jgi:hypothetical protein
VKMRYAHEHANYLRANFHHYTNRTLSLPVNETGELKRALHKIWISILLYSPICARICLPVPAVLVLGLSNDHASSMHAATQA